MSKEFDELKKVIKNEDEAVDVQLDDTELEDSIKDDDEDHEESHMEKFSAMVRQSLAEEHEAAAQYTKRAAKCEKHGMEDAAKLFRDIAAEEVVHAGEFQALMEKYGVLDQESIDQGEQEGKEILDGEKTEPEIDAPEIPADDTENESVNEEFLDKGTLEQRMIQIFDYNQEDYKAVELLKMLTRFMDVDQLQKFYEYIQEETDINYDEVFKSSNESTNEDYLNASPDQDYALKSLLPGEQHIPIKYYTERNIRNIYCSYLVQDMPDTSTMKDVDKINAAYDEIRSKADNDPIDEILDFLNKTGDLEVHKRTENESINEGWNEDIYQYLVDYADQQGLNVADLAEYDPAEIADWISDRSGFPVDAEDVKDMIDANVQDTSSIAKENDEIHEDGTVASAGEAPTVVAGKGVIEAKPTKMCEELKALKEILEN